ncbi:MAG TPA: ATP-binding protein, partial [Anaerolineae bacterium]|nr:ATP-binding protein [Anaerolineae bacterium]
MSAINPFFHRGPIHDQRYFYGRDYETAQVLSLVAQRQSVSLVGQRHIGKTSLLNHISNPLVFAQHGLKRDQALFVYVDGSTLSGLDPPQVYRVLLEDIQFSLAHSTSTPDWFNLTESGSISYRDFEQALNYLTHQGQQIVLLLDEFEHISHQPQL